VSPNAPYWKDDDERPVPETLSADDEHDGCPKCGHDEAETGGIAVTGDGLSRYVDYQNQEFVVVSCAGCGYSEFYRRDGAGDLLDLFFG
jgi:predicted nucleic-acid-binding Zn-ribbon protein